jgi:hypothetical protein
MLSRWAQLRDLEASCLEIVRDALCEDACLDCTVLMYRRGGQPQNGRSIIRGIFALPIAEIKKNGVAPDCCFCRH